MIRRLAFILFFILVPYTASAQISSGTVIVFGVSRDKVIVAGDSRGLTAGSGGVRWLQWRETKMQWNSISSGKA
jgi:hypothetical protein